MSRLVTRLRALLGRRGAALAILGLVFLVVGLKSLLSPADDAGRFILYTFLPPYLKGALWIVPALLAIFASFRRGPGKDAFGFAALVIPSTVVAFSYLWSWVGYFLGATDWPLGWSSASIWLSILALVLVISGWRERPNAPDGDPDA